MKKKKENLGPNVHVACHFSVHEACHVNVIYDPEGIVAILDGNDSL